MNHIQELRRIGAGFCGTVWAAADGSAFKREDGGPQRSLLNDYNMHQHIQTCIKDHQNGSTENSTFQIQIPTCYQLLTPSSIWWLNNLNRFPSGYQPCNMIHAQRIPPIPEKSRRLLTERYCPPQLVSEIMASDTNRDCLIRPYLGRRRFRTTSRGMNSSRSRFKAFSLRNYPLHVDQMEEIGISEQDIIGYARTMATTLAIMHWAAEVDGNDVEFVLAAPNDQSPVENEPESKRESIPRKQWSKSNPLDQHEMWILDFDLVRTMKMDSQGVQQAVRAFWGNDPFYPRPVSDQHSALWEAFREEYLRTSKICILGKECSRQGDLLSLPSLFIRLLEGSTNSL